MGISKFSKGQAAILEAIPRAIAEDKPLVVPSGNAQGKDFIVSCVAPWFLYNYAPSKVINTAPTDRQVKEIIWSELQTRWNNAKVELPGRILSNKIDIEPDWFALGFTTKEAGSATGKAQGFHSPHICVIASEAQAIEDPIFEQLDSILNALVNLLIMIGNPLRTSGVFARAIDDTTNNIVVRLDCLDSPNYRSKENVIPGMASYSWIEKKRKQWNPEGTEDHPLWLARVRGQKPRSSIDTVFGAELVERLVTTIPRVSVRKIVTSVDPAGMGDDEQVIYGGMSGEIIKQDIKPQCKAPESCSLVLQVVKETGSNHITIDADGMGAPIAQFLEKLKPNWITLEEVHGNGVTLNPQYQNQRAEMWFYAKEEAEAGRESIPDDEFLKQELMEVKYFINLRGKIQIEDKDDIKERIKRSPNRADAWILNVWGRKSSKIVRTKNSWEDDRSAHEVGSGVKSAMAA